MYVCTLSKTQHRTAACHSFKTSHLVKGADPSLSRASTDQQKPLSKFSHQSKFIKQKSVVKIWEYNAHFYRLNMINSKMKSTFPLILFLVLESCFNTMAFLSSDSSRTNIVLKLLRSTNVDHLESKITSPETASVSPGQVLTIRIGDTSLARKAWKKRRRTGSPILVPCTILSMNRELMTKMNMINLVHRFGKPMVYDSHNGIGLSVGAMVKLYKHRLGGELIDHATTLGYKTIVDFLNHVFDEGVLREYGVTLARVGAKRELVILSSLSLRLARESSLKAEFVQFQPDEQNFDRMIHTGTTFQVEKDAKYQTITDPAIIRPLSAAVRISQTDADSGRFQSGMECNAFVHNYDSQGDNGSPLITCAIDPPKSQIRDQMKRRSYVKRQEDAKQKRKDEIKVSSKLSLYNLGDLNVGDGPFEATVVRVSSHSGAAFVDFGVSRKNGKKHGGGTAQVYGMLTSNEARDFNHQIAVESEEEDAFIEASLMNGSSDDDDGVLTIDDLFMSDDENEFEEDLSDVISVDDNGNILSFDPQSGESTIIGTVDSDEEPDDDDHDDGDNMFVGMTPQERLTAIGDIFLSQKDEKMNTRKERYELRKGDNVQVFIRSVSVQSGRFTVTIDPNIKSRKLKDIKRESEADKRIMRLASKFGRGNGLKALENVIGTKLEGTIKAKSKAGEWYYIMPADDQLPVGIGTSSTGSQFQEGQRVSIEIEGIDESRGQFSFSILGST